MKSFPRNIPVCLAVIAVTLAAFFITLVRSEVIGTHEVPLVGMDSGWYISTAQGDHGEVQSPFSRRVLYPGMAHLLSLVTGASLRYSFFFLSLLSFSLLAYSLAWMFKIFGLSPWLIAVFLLTPFPVIGLEVGYMPDLFAGALTALCFLFLLQERYFWALFSLAVCYPARENTSVVCVLLAILAWWRGKRWIAFCAGLVFVLGGALGAWFVRLGRPNIHHLPDGLYLLLKAPHQFLKNVLGVRIWTNTLPVGEPWIKFTLPPQLSAGDVHEIGICPIDYGYPIYTFLTILTIFGVMPLLLWKARHFPLWSRKYPLAIQLATWAGGVGLLLGTSIGDEIERLLGYGWPLFWIAGPYIIARFIPAPDRKRLSWFYVAVVVLAWSPEFVRYNRWQGAVGSLLAEMLLIIFLSYGIAWLQIRKINFREVKTRAA